MQEKKENQSEQVSLFSFDLITVVRDVLKRWYLIVAAVLLAAMAAYTVTQLLYKPAYTTNTTFVVSVQDSSGTVYQNLSATSNLASVFSEVLNSSILRSKILAQLGMRSFDGTISAEAIAETNLLTLRVTASDPRTAFLVTRSIIENHASVSYQVLGDTVLEVLQAPVVPTAPSNPMNAASNLKKAALLAALGMIVLLAAMSYSKDVVRSKQEAEKKLGCRVLAEIHHEKKHKTLRSRIRRKKTSVLITNPTISFSFVETFRKLRRRVEQHMPKGGNVLLITSVLENEGKSTVAVNLALTMAKKGKRILLIDCDMRKPACHKILEVNWHGDGTADVATGRTPLESAVLHSERTGLYMLLERRKLRNSTGIASSETMERMIREASARYDFVILDTPPMSAAPDTESLMEFADGTILVVQQNVARADAINGALAALGGAKSKLLGCALNNMYTSFLSHSGGYGYGYGRYGKYGKYGKYGQYGAYSTKKSEQ